MATYRQISDSEVAVDAPLTQQLMQAYKDNLTSVIEDDASAPSIKRSAISDALSDQKLAVAGNVSIGAEEILTAASSNDEFSAVYIVAVSGKYNIRGAIKKTAASGTARCEIYVNNSLVATGGYIGSTTFDQSPTLTDYQLNAGDEVKIKMDEGNNLYLSLIHISEPTRPY